MRLRLITVILTVTLLFALAASGAAGVARAQSQQGSPSDNDDSRVPVQLVVFGIAAFLVVGVGTVAFVARRKLGLDTPPPSQDASSHH